jgi:hypothetical protein
MAFNRIDSLINTGVPATEALALQDQLTGLGGSATQPSQGGGSIGPSGNSFTYFSQTGTGNGADTTEDTLQTYTLPANALDKAGRSIYIYAWGSYVNTNGTKNARLYFGTQSIAAQSAGQVGNTSWALEFVVGKAAANQQVVSGQIVVGTAHGGVVNSSPTITDTAAITIKVTGQNSTSANANTVVLNGLFVTYSN